MYRNLALVETFIASTERLAEIIRRLGEEQQADVFSSRAALARRRIVALRRTATTLARRHPGLNLEPARRDEVASDHAVDAHRRPVPLRQTGLVRPLRGLITLLDGYDRLTPREREVSLLLVQGCSNREIAERLVISPGTAANHVASVLNKLGSRSRAQLLAAVFGLVGRSRYAGETEQGA